MRAITVQQPWATLIAIGAKRIETRSWATAYRGPLAIHAGLNTENIEYFFEAPFRALLEAAGIRGVSDLPLGVVVATARLVDCIETSLIERYVRPFSAQERAFGNYEPQRFGWLLEGVQRVDPPIKARGKQGLWEWK
jgi:activating signal cointegrator 1